MHVTFLVYLLKCVQSIPKLLQISGTVITIYITFIRQLSGFFFFFLEKLPRGGEIEMAVCEVAGHTVLCMQMT